MGLAREALRFGIKNTYDGAPYPQKCLQRALEIIDRILLLGWDEPSDCYPLPDEEICLEWQQADGHIIRLFFYGDERDRRDANYYGMVMVSDGTNKPFFITVDLDDMSGVWPLPRL